MTLQTPAVTPVSRLLVQQNDELRKVVMALHEAIDDALLYLQAPYDLRYLTRDIGSACDRLREVHP